MIFYDFTSLLNFTFNNNGKRQLLEYLFNFFDSKKHTLHYNNVCNSLRLMNVKIKLSI